MTSTYLHGSDPEEQSRLSTLNTLINEPALRQLDLRGGERILDVGSGLGQFTRAMARRAGVGGYIVGIERNLEQLAEARRQAQEDGEDGLVDLRAGDALDLPLASAEWGSFDVAHCRFVLEHVPRPLDVVRGMARAVRPGSRVVLADDDHDILRLYPEPPGFSALWLAYVRTYDRLGNDPFVGRRLVALLHAAGLSPNRSALLNFGNCAGSPSFSIVSANMTSILAGARTAIVDNDLLEPDRFDAALEAFQKWSERPDAAVWYGISWAEGIRATL